MTRLCALTLLAVQGAAAVCTSAGGAGCETVQQLHGAGTTNPSKLFWEVLGLMEARAKVPITSSYRAVGSSTGQQEFVGATNSYVAINDFGAGDIPMSAANFASLTSDGRDREMVHVPFALGGIGIFYSLAGVTETVRLNACVLAKIFKRSITVWNDAAITALNPSITLPATAIKVVHRVEGSSSTTGFTQYLAQECPADWTGTGTGSGSTITWASGTNEAQGSGGMSSFIAAHDGAIGYIDSGHGHEHSLNEAELQNANNEWLTTLTTGCIANAGTIAVNNALFPTDPKASFADVKLYNLPGTNVWPITMVSYFYIEKDLSARDADTVALLLAFVELILSTEGQTLAEDNLFVKLPQALLDYNTATISDQLTLPAATEKFTFETADTTQKEVGAGVKVISGKRQSYAAWKNDRQDIDIATLQTLVQRSHVRELHGAGTTNPSRFFWETLDLIEARSKVPIHTTYRAVGSSTGQQEFVAPTNSYVALNDFGAGDIPMSATNFQTLSDNGRTMVHVPFALGGIGIFYSLAGVSGTVRLNACVLAKIFKRSITVWNDAAITALNPSITLPATAIKVVHRVEGSSSTTGFTQYLAQECPADWTGTGTGSGSTITWASGTNEAQGSGGMSSFIAAHDGAIGYIDSGHGHEHSLNEAELQNANNEWLTTLTTGCIANAGTIAVNNALFPTDPTASFANVKLYNLPGANVWPITMVSYFYLNKDLSAMDADTAALLYAFVEMTLSTEGQALAEANLFVKLPQELLDYNTATLSGLTLPSDIRKFTFETATTTQKEVGAGLTVISGKRQTYADWRNARQETDIAALTLSVAQVRAIVEADPDFTGWPTVTTTTVQQTDSNKLNLALGTGIAGLVFGLLGFLLGIGALVTASSSAKNANLKRRPSQTRGQPVLELRRPSQNMPSEKV